MADESSSGSAVQMSVRLGPASLEALDRYISQLDPRPSRHEALQRAVVRSLREYDYYVVNEERWREQWRYAASDVADFRQRFNVSRPAMAEWLGVSLPRLQTIEKAGGTSDAEMSLLAVERLALRFAVLGKVPAAVPPSVRNDVYELASLLRGRAEADEDDTSDAVTFSVRVEPGLLEALEDYACSWCRGSGLQEALRRNVLEWFRKVDDRLEDDWPEENCSSVAYELVKIRERLNASQPGMAGWLGMSTRDYQAIEEGKQLLRVPEPMLRLAAQRLALRIGAQRNLPLAIPPAVRADAFALASLVQGGADW